MVVVRYIKLGRAGGWENECLSDGTVRLGFKTAEFFDDCSKGRWDVLASRYRADKRSPGKVTETVNQVRSFFEDDGSTYWITFSRRLMWWCQIDPSSFPYPHPSGHGSVRATQGGWRSVDELGQPLHMDGLSGALTQLAGYRGTSCRVSASEYAYRRITGRRLPVVLEAERLSEELRLSVVSMLRHLTPSDFELLVDLVFSASGWRRLGVVGKTEKTIDMELELPTTGERAFVQVKSKATQREFDDEYLEAFQSMAQTSRMFFVYHTGEIACDVRGITLLGPDRFARMVMDAGLVSWLIRRVS